MFVSNCGMPEGEKLGPRSFIACSFLVQVLNPELHWCMNSMSVDYISTKNNSPGIVECIKCTTFEILVNPVIKICLHLPLEVQ